MNVRTTRRGVIIKISSLFQLYDGLTLAYLARNDPSDYLTLDRMYRKYTQGSLSSNAHKGLLLRHKDNEHLEYAIDVYLIVTDQLSVMIPTSMMLNRAQWHFGKWVKPALSVLRKNGAMNQMVCAVLHVKWFFLKSYHNL